MANRQEPKLRAVRPTAALTVSNPAFLQDGGDFEFRRMIHDSLAFAARLEAIRDGFARLIGISGIQYTILVSVYHLQFDENVGVSRVAEHLHLSGAFITNETTKLVRLGLLEKQTDPDDRRRSILRTTPEAQQRLARLAEIQSEVNDEHFSPLADGEKFDAFREIVGDLVESTDRALALLHGLTPRALANGDFAGDAIVGAGAGAAPERRRRK